MCRRLRADSATITAPAGSRSSMRPPLPPSTRPLTSKRLPARTAAGTKSSTMPFGSGDASNSIGSARAASISRGGSPPPTIRNRAVSACRRNAVPRSGTCSTSLRAPRPATQRSQPHLRESPVVSGVVPGVSTTIVPATKYSSTRGGKQHEIKQSPRRSIAARCATRSIGARARSVRHTPASAAKPMSIPAINARFMAALPLPDLSLASRKASRYARPAASGAIRVSTTVAGLRQQWPQAGCATADGSPRTRDRAERDPSPRATPMHRATCWSAARTQRSSESMSGFPCSSSACQSASAPESSVSAGASADSRSVTPLRSPERRRHSSTAGSSRPTRAR